MNTPLSWIKAYVPGLDVTAQEYTDAMTLSGTKVEGFVEMDKNLEKIVIGQIEKIEKHPDAPRASCRRGDLPRCDHHSLILSSSPTSPVRPYDRPRLPFRPNYHPGSPITYSAASQLSTKIQPDFSTSSCRILSLHPVMFVNSLHPQQLLPHYYSLSACTS